ncbi:MAG: glycosyltransferase family 2 protein [Deltaproteobacteria bacterium]|nr:glycosyltransferase family 2 protein [Deltaproteobacteria bacterium]
MRDHISICIPTFKRNKSLEHLLRNLATQRVDDLFDFSVVVVDNSAEGLARETVMRLKKELDLDITYSIEPEQTIPAARNHALRLAQGNHIAIIDDDEIPPRDWLSTMYNALKTFGVDGCLGPVHPYFEQLPPTWLLKGKFCERPVYRTGTLLHWNQTRTGNVLLKKEVFDKHGLRFDVDFKTGGSDQEFFRQAIKVGCRFIAVKEAPVYEVVPQNRWTKTYYFKRAIINGYNSYKYIKREQKTRAATVTLVKSAGAAIVYTFFVPFCVIFGEHLLMKCVEKGAYHFSRLLAFLGIELIKKRDL